MSDKLKDKLFGNSKARGIITVVAPIIIGATLSGAFSLTTSPLRIFLWIFSAILVIALIVFLVMCGKYDDEQMTELNTYKEKTEILRNDLEQTRNKFDILSGVYKNISRILHNDSNDLHNLVKKKKSHSEIDNWKELQSNCNVICDELLTLVKSVSECGEKFSVSIIFKRVTGNLVEFNMLSRESYSGHYPAMHNTFKKEEEFKNYHFKHLFDSNISRPNYLTTKEEIRVAFSNCDGVDYSQYMGIPIACTGNKMIGILQIISYEDSIIAKNKQQMEKLYNDYFCAFANLILLADKIENIEQLIS